MSATTVKPKRKRQKPEEVMQIHFFRWLFYRDRKLWKISHAIPNGGSRNIIEAANMKLAGVKAGVPDIFIPRANRNYHGLYIELKVKPNKPSPEQIEMMNDLEEEGYFCGLCYSLQEAMDCFEQYMKD